MKGYTDLEQSKKLAEFLPLKSADMYYSKHDTIHANTLYGSCDIQYFNIREYIPCWSLAVLLDIIPYAIHKSDSEFYRLEIDKGYNDYAVWYSNNGLTVDDLDVTSDNFVDACVEMIIKLHEQNLL